MDEALHKIDEIFNKAYQQYEHQPSEAAWEKLNAMLDKEDAGKYKKRFIGWKRVAIMLLLLLSGLLIYESWHFLSNKSGKDFTKNDNHKNSVSDKIDKANHDVAVDNTNKPIQKGLNIPMKIPGQPVILQEETPDLVVLFPESAGKEHGKNNRQRIAQKQQRSEAGKSNKTIPNRKTDVLTSLETTWEKTGIPNESLSNEKITKKGNFQRKLIIPSVERITSPIIGYVNINPKKFNPALISHQLLAKSAIAKNKKKSAVTSFKPYWTLTAFVSNDWGQYELDNDVQDNNNNSHDDKEEIHRREKHESSLSAGVLASRQLSKKWGVKTGLIYANTAIMIDPQLMHAVRQADGNIAYKYLTSSGYGFVKPGFGLPPAVGDSLQSTKAQHNLQSLSVPLLLVYRIDKKKLSIMPSAGITANFITNATVKTEVSDALNREAVLIHGLKALRNFYVGFMADVNLQYNFNNTWALNVLPTFKYALMPITKSNVVKTYPYSLGIGAAISYKF